LTTHGRAAEQERDVPKVSKAHLEARREQILDAALACFARNGFHETTIQDIAREADLSHGAIYRYFPSKDDIIEETSARDRRGRARRFAEALDGAAPVDALDRIFTAYVEQQAAPGHQDTWRLRIQLIGEAILNPKVNALFRETWAEVFARLAGLVRQGQEQGEIDPDLDPVSVARVIAAVHNGIALQQTIDPTVDADGCMDVIRALLRNGLGGGGHDEPLRAEARGAVAT
jgi:AcrR family transcriptional regulator